MGEMAKKAPVVNETPASQRIEFYQESKKAIALAYKRQEELQKEIEPEMHIRFLKEDLKSAKSFEEAIAIEEQIKKFELQRKYGTNKGFIIPIEHHQTIKNNLKIEHEHAAEMLLVYQNELLEKMEYLEKEVRPLLENINQIVQSQSIPQHVELVLGSTYNPQVPLPPSFYYGVFGNGTNKAATSKSLIAVDNLLSAMNDLKAKEVKKSLFKRLTGVN